jgi:hypothetical protein
LSHLTPRYAIDKLLQYHYERLNRDAPWLTPQAISILSTALRKTDRGLEYGCGRSTLWFAKRTAWLISIENNLPWYERITAAIQSDKLGNVSLKYLPIDEKLKDDPYRTEYIAGEPNLLPESLDYALVDGYYRDQCALRVVDLIKMGGLLILDNANWFIPHTTKSPMSASTVASPAWGEFLLRVTKWRLIWTTNGVFDTAIWLKAGE